MNNDLAETTQTPRPANRIYFVLCWFFGGWLGLHFLYLKKYIWCAVTILWLISVFVTRIPQLGHLYWWFVVLSGLLFYRTKQEKMRHIVWSFILQAVLVILFIFSIPFFLSFGHRENHKKYMCQARLKLIGIHIQLYQMDYKQFPDKLESLRQVTDIKDDDFICPQTGEKFIYSVPAAPKEKVFPLAYDSLLCHHKGGAWVLWSDGNVQYCPKPDNSGKFATVEELFDYARKERWKNLPQEKKGSQ